jgi:signal transduction histidine kinase
MYGRLERCELMRLTTKFYTSILAVTVLALLSSVLGLYATWQMAIYMRELTDDDLRSVREAERLESALLKQSDCDESYLLDGGNQRWLKILAGRKSYFQQCLDTAKSTTHDSTEVDILTRLENAYHLFDAKRDEVFAIYDSGDAAKAKLVLLDDLDPLSDHVNAICEEFIDYIEHHIDAATSRTETRTSHIMWIAGGFLGLTAVSGIGLLWLFIRGVHAPLRKMLADARMFTDVGRSDTNGAPNDEFGAVGFYMRALASDVTNVRSALQRSRQQAMNAEKLASVGKLAASVAHEIRNPLIAVKLWLTSIQKKRHEDLELSSNLGMISDEITRLDGIVREFLEFSRPQTLKIEPLQISALLDETLELVSHRSEESRINIIREYSVELPPIMGDWKQLKQMFINLLNNAAEAMIAGGEIRVIACQTVDNAARQMVVVRVQDNGPGVSEDVRQRLFEPFYTTKESGTGLGLCIASGIMTRHGGRLVLESSSDRGTTFAVWIPTATIKQDANLHLSQPHVKVHQ